MEFIINRGAAEKLSSACLVLGVAGHKKLTGMSKVIDQLSGGAITATLNDGDFSGKAGSTLLLRDLANVQSRRVLLVGLGEAKTCLPRDWLSAVRAAAKQLNNLGANDAAWCLLDVKVAGEDPTWCIEQSVLALAESQYRFDTFKSKPKPKAPALTTLQLHIDKKMGEEAEAAVLRGQALARGSALTRDLGNMPPNVCTPSYLAETAHKIAATTGLAIEVLEEADMRSLGMGALLAVSKGSVEPPKFIILKHAGGDAKQKPVVLVGKGITFDTGGISLKPGEGMDEMKYDMCGAATVLGVMQAAAELALPLNLIGVIATCENMPSGHATRPGDIVTSLSGQTIEILNTDAEGRLILCDALTYVERFNPQAVVDIATLTGACIVALGHVASALFSTDDDLATELEAAAAHSRDWIWRMPMFPEYDDLLKSNFADMANIGGRAAGSASAAAFLARYTKAYPWAHLDIAGTAWKSGAAKGATGRPVPLLLTFLAHRADGAKKSKKKA